MEYLEEVRGMQASQQPLQENFLAWHRTRQYDSQKHCMVFRGGRHQQTGHKTFVVACRYWYELTDGFWGQLVLTQIPHCDARLESGGPERYFIPGVRCWAGAKLE